VSDLVKASKLFANGGHQRITAHRNPALQSFEMHLKSVAQIVSSVSHDEETIAAAWLHDIVEDTDVTIGDVERIFGAKVAGLVGELTFVSHPTRGNRAARIAFEKEYVANASAPAKIVKLADLIDTIRDLYKNDRHRSVGTPQKRMSWLMFLAEGTQIFLRG
jgi:(p)ppGpp synthase/HD superfamily hydrolase